MPCGRPDRHHAGVSNPFRLLRESLWNLSLEPADQRSELNGTAVTDELALDLANAVESLERTQQAAGTRPGEDLLAEVRRLNALLAAQPDDAMWEDDSLDRHPTWAEARRLARSLLPLVPSA